MAMIFPYKFAEFARLSGVSKIVIGRSVAAKEHLFSKPTLTEKLIAHAPNLDVHIIPDTTSPHVSYYAKKIKRNQASRYFLQPNLQRVSVF